MSKDIIIYIHSPDLAECPQHNNEEAIINGLLLDINDVLKYSFVINEDRSISYFGHKLDFKNSVNFNQSTGRKYLNFEFNIRGINCNCSSDLTDALSSYSYDKQFIKDYTNLLRATIKTIGMKTNESIHNPTKYIKFVDIKRHLIK